MATIKDVAREASVSIATVSHVVNQTRRVSDELTARVLAAMQKLHYRPNGLARSLRLGQTRTLGMLIPDNSNQFFAEMARSIEDTGYRHGYSVILCNSDRNVEKQRTYVRVLVDKQVDGIAFISSGESAEDIQYLTREGVAVVIVDREQPGTSVDVIVIDNERAGYEATRHLLGFGHRRIACITGPAGVAPAEGRVVGYRLALRDAGIEYDPALVIPGDFGMETGERAGDALWKLPPELRPTAIFSCNDLMAIGAMVSLRRYGVEIPSDVSIVGIDDIALSRAVSPALTTMSHPKVEMGRLAAELLIQRIEGHSAGMDPQRVVLTATLVRRDSCAAPAAR